MTAKRIVILTSCALRHDFMRKAMALDPEIQVLRTYREDTTQNLKEVVEKAPEGQDAMNDHLAMRDRSERDFFQPFVDMTPDHSNPVTVGRGEVNSPEVWEEISRLSPEAVCVYGTSLIKAEHIEGFPGVFLNVHLGLSPYYRGCATNFWPLVESRPECVGCTFMHIDPGIDTGEVIHQIRARAYPEDTPHSLGNRLIADMVVQYRKLVRNLHRLTPQPQLEAPESARVCYRKDFSPEAVATLYDNFAKGMLRDHLAVRREREALTPLVTQPDLEREGE